MPRSKDNIYICTRKYTVSVGGNILVTRSRSLIVFICVLLKIKKKNNNLFSIGIEELRSYLPSVHGKQMQRFVDSLAGIAFPIGFESKTRGRYWLTAPLDLVQIDIGDAELNAFLVKRADVNPNAIQFTASSFQATVDTVALGLRVPLGLVDPALISISRLVSADLQFQDGNLDSDTDHAYDILRKEVKSAEVEFRAIALFKLTKVCIRLNRYTEAQEALRCIRGMVQSGLVASGNVDSQIKLLAAMIRIDQGRTAEAQTIFDGIDLSACSDDWLRCQHHRVAGLLLWNSTVSKHQIIGRGIPPVDGDPDPVMDSFEEAIVLHQRSLQLAIGINNYHAAQRSCMDLGQVHLDAYRIGLPLPDRDHLLTRGINWVAQCELICIKFGVGMDSVRSKILLLSIAVDFDLQLCDLNQRTGGLFKNFATYGAMANFALVEARRIGNNFEQASVLTILASISRSSGDVEMCSQFQQQAMDLYKAQNRPDMVRQLKKKFEPTGGTLVAGIFA